MAPTVRNVAFCASESPLIHVMMKDEKLVASTRDDGVLRLWNVGNFEQRGTLRPDRLYERLDITGVQGLTHAQKESLLAPGAVEDETIPS